MVNGWDWENLDIAIAGGPLKIDLRETFSFLDICDLIFVGYSSIAIHLN